MGLEWTFDTEAAAYEKLRPGYCEELYRTIFDYISIDASSNVVEVGIGAGQATLPFLKKGCKLTAIEYGEQLSQLCREKFKAYPGFDVITNKFENVKFESHAYDLVYSASAFHWVPEEAGYRQVHCMLKDGGAFARFANHPFRCKDNIALSEAIDEVYAQYYYKYYHKTPQKPAEYSESDAKKRALIAEQYGFTDIQYALFHRTRTFRADAYTALLGTYSDHIAMEENVREVFFSKIKDVINHYGGSITIYDTMDLQLAKK